MDILCCALALLGGVIGAGFASGREIVRFFAAHGAMGFIAVTFALAALLALFAQDVPGLRIINLGGEMCPQALVDQWATPGRQMFNTYGPTEATVSASLAELRRHRRRDARGLRGAFRARLADPPRLCPRLRRHGGARRAALRV